MDFNGSSPFPEGVISFLDTDLYKLTMQCAVLKYFSKIRVTYAFHNRTPEKKLSRAAFNWLQAQINSQSLTNALPLTSLISKRTGQHRALNRRVSLSEIDLHLPQPALSRFPQRVPPEPARANRGYLYPREGHGKRRGYRRVLSEHQGIMGGNNSLRNPPPCSDK